MNLKIAVGASVALWLAAAGLSIHIHPGRYDAGRSRDPVTTVKMNQSSLARILGEFRTGMSDMLFIKTERYLHGGIGYVPHLTEQLLTVQGTGDEVAHFDHDHDDGEECSACTTDHDHEKEHVHTADCEHAVAEHEHDHGHDHEAGHDHDHGEDRRGGYRGDRSPDDAQLRCTEGPEHQHA